MLKPKVKAREFERLGFKRCKGIPKESECYYLCIARGQKMLFVSDSYFGVNDWNKDDPRIHKKLIANTEIAEQPIAFDVENIIKQLEKERDYSYEDYENYAEKHDIDVECDDLFCRGLDRAIEIVKRGGRDEE